MSEGSNTFDEAAALAAEHLKQLVEEWTASEKRGALSVMEWFASNYAKAGHKRLGRLIVRTVKDLEGS